MGKGSMGSVAALRHAASVRTRVSGRTSPRDDRVALCEHSASLSVAPAEGTNLARACAHGNAAWLTHFRCNRKAFDSTANAPALHAVPAWYAARGLFLGTPRFSIFTLPNPLQGRKGTRGLVLVRLLPRIRITHPTSPAIWPIMVHTSSSYRPTQSLPVYRCRRVVSPSDSRLTEEGHTGVSSNRKPQPAEGKSIRHI